MDDQGAGTARRPDTSPMFFESLYARSEDPWDFRTSTYELERYALICELARRARPGVDGHGRGFRRYRHIYEPGCSIGELTARLALLGERVSACDVSDRAVSLARARCRTNANVDIRTGSVAEGPPGGVDLIVLSEIGYYFSAANLGALLRRLRRSAMEDCILLACHWLGESDDHVLHGAEVHRLIGEFSGAAWLAAPDGPPECLIECWRW